MRQSARRYSLMLGLLSATFIFPFCASGQTAGSSTQTMSALTKARLAAKDTDRDGIPDAVEKQIGTDPNNPDSNHNGIWDGDETMDGAGMSYSRAYQQGLLSSDDDGDDSDDDDMNPAPTPSGVHQGPRPQLLPVCKRPRQKRCRLPYCTKPKQKNCKPRPKNPSPNPTVRPTTNPTVKPTTNPVPGTGNFDANGNTTKFGIPAGLTGNINAGGSLWGSLCSGCHNSEKTGRSYGQLQNAFTIPVMAGIRPSSSQIANLTAYLNRASK